MNAKLESATCRALAGEWSRLNRDLFRGALRPPVIQLTDARAVLARWMPAPRVIEVGRHTVREHAWGVVVEVLKHEMAHQFAHEVLGAVDETAHGRAFREVCERFAIDARASGLPDASPVDDRVLRRVSRLLALAGSDNRNEAELATNAAQKLMLEHNIATLPEGYVWRHLGRPTARVQAHERALAGLLARHFFVQVIWARAFRPDDGRHGDVLEVCGTPENVAMAEYVHDFLARTGEALWRAHKRERGIAADRDRRRFLAGVLRGFETRLAEQARRHAETGLVWVGDPGVDAYMRRRYPRIRTLRYSVANSGEAWGSGFARGREIVLHKPVAGTASSRGRLIEG